MKKTRIRAAVVVTITGLLYVNSASAILITSSVGGAPQGVNYVTFDGLVLGTTSPQFAPTTAGSAVNENVTVTLTPDAQVVVGAASGAYAAPMRSGGQGALFDGQPNGVDATEYLTSGSEGNISFPNAAVTLTFNQSENYLGLLWGSVDTYNTLTFYLGNTVVASVTGTQVSALPNGDQGPNGTYYVNISGVTFDSVVATSSQYAFEFDDVSYGIVPDGGMTAMLLGVGLLGLGWARRMMT